MGDRNMETAPFSRDAREVLTEALVEKEIAFRANLKAAINTAGGHLEWLKPAILGAGRGGIVSSMAANVAFGAIVILFADRRRVFELHLTAAGQTEVPRAIAWARDVVPNARDPGNTLHAIRVALDCHGRPVGTPAPGDFDAAVGLQILGMVLAPAADAQVSDSFDRMNRVIAEGVCPAMVGLIGPATSAKRGNFCGVFPLMVPIARYAELVTAPLGYLH
jgi:hypothetical protein